MRVIFSLSCLTLLLWKCALAAPSLEYQIVELDPLNSEAVNYDSYSDEYIRDKRSGSPDFFGAIKKKISSGVQSKLQLLGSASAGFSSGSSGGSGGHGGGHGSFGGDVSVHKPAVPAKDFNWWALKKSILASLLQAVKGITGGVIAFKGQLIQGSGQLIQTKGKLVASKGEAISNFGRQIATSAIASASSSSGYQKPISVVHHSAPSAPSAPSAGYSYTSMSGPSYEAPEQSYGVPDTYETHTYDTQHHHVPSSNYGIPSAPASLYGASTHEYGPPKYNSAYEVFGKLPPGLESLGILYMKPVKYSSKYRKPRPTSSKNRYPAAPLVPVPIKTEYELINDYGPPSTEHPVSKPGLVQKVVGASAGFSGSSASSVLSGSSSGSSEAFDSGITSPANSYGPPSHETLTHPPEPPVTSLNIKPPSTSYGYPVIPDKPNNPPTLESLEHYVSKDQEKNTETLQTAHSGLTINSPFLPTPLPHGDYPYVGFLGPPPPPPPTQTSEIHAFSSPPSAQYNNYDPYSYGTNSRAYQLYQSMSQVRSDRPTGNDGREKRQTTTYTLTKDHTGLNILTKKT